MQLLATVSLLTAGVGAAVLTPAAQSLFDWSMHIQDLRFDETYHLIAYPDNGPWSTRFTAWYTAGLLHRAQGDDVANAKAALESILACQMTESYDAPWYGTFKLSPDEPYPTADSPLYPPSIYGSYDPNWREFIGTALVQVVEEFEHLLGDDLVGRIEDALEIAAVGSMRRNGTFPEDDNLTPSYSNPSLMRAWYVGWIGARRKNETFLQFAATSADDVFALFSHNGTDVLSEYNAPTYYGMDLWALVGAARYGCRSKLKSDYAPRMLRAIWKDIADHYNPYLGNLVGPYDRAYTRDMTSHSAILSQFWWGIFGHEYGPQPPKTELDLVYDIAQGAALALMMDTASKFIDSETEAALKAKGLWKGDRLVTKYVYDAPFTFGPQADVRVATSWLSAPLMIGAEQVAEPVNRGKQFVPAIVHWAGDPLHQPYPLNTFFSLYPTASTIDAVAGPNSLVVSYPNTTQDGTGIFTYALSNVPPSWTLHGAHVIDGLTSLPCLNVTVDAPGLKQLPTVYGSQLEDHWYYNISYVVPDDFKGVPTMKFGFEYVC